MSTVRRVGPNPQPFRRNLGYLLITVDDLRELMDLLRTKLSDPTELRVEFEGGTFADPSDLKNLNDEEAASLAIKTPNLQVILGLVLRWRLAIKRRLMKCTIGGREQSRGESRYSCDDLFACPLWRLPP